MSGSFEVSEDFAAFEAETATAAAEAGAAEKMTMGIKMPMGTTGIASVCGIKTGRSKIKEDPKTKQQTGNEPMVTIEIMVDTPNEFVGTKQLLFFTFSQTAKQTVAQRYQRFYDALQDMGMPKELRGKTLQEVGKFFCGDTIRKFQYEITPQWDKPTVKVFTPVAGLNAQLPDVKDIQTTTQAPTFTVKQTVMAAGNPCEVIAVNDAAKTLRVKFPNGQEMDVPMSNCSAQ